MEKPQHNQIDSHNVHDASHLSRAHLSHNFPLPFLDWGLVLYKEAKASSSHRLCLSYAESASPDEPDEEFDTFPTSRSYDLVRMRYDRLRSAAVKIQMVVDDVASQGERLQYLLRWRDPRVTVLCTIIHLVAVIVFYVTPFKVVALLTGFFVLRHPRFRRHRRLPSILMNFFRRLPARTDCIL